MYVDNDLIYLGGDFKFNNTYGAAIYNQTSKTLQSMPFHGFGENSSINAITKILDDSNDSLGSIIFGGKFNTLGLSDLLTHNITTNSTKLNNSNSTNTSLITAEQIISLKHGTFTTVNSASDDDASGLICPSKNEKWTVTPDVGGEWAVELPDEMKGVTPTKVRLYNNDGDNSVGLFRIYSFPNNGIMNLSYVDPVTHDLVYCDAWCPLLKISQLADSVDANKKNQENLTDGISFVNDDGSFATYYTDDRVKTLGYGANYQEFSFENEVAIDKIGVTIVSWHGNQGVLSGFELYTNSIDVYGNDTLNEPNCEEEDDDNVSNFSDINHGSFVSVQSLSSAVTDNDYLVSIVNSSLTGVKPSITLFPNISYSGNYSLILNTPGCIQDNSCEKRSIVNVTVTDNEDQVLASKLIYQNNNYQKFDYLFYGHLNGSSDSDGHNKIQITYHDSALENVAETWMVVDKATINIVGLDNYYDYNSTNSTKKRNSTASELTYIHLNGLFEYSLANFSNFDETLVSSNKSGKTVISVNNTFVGNSSINLLSSQLSKNSTIEQFDNANNTLRILGDFQSNSRNLTLGNNNLVSLSLDSYNSTTNETMIASIISKRWSKRDEESTKIYGATFNNSITKMINLDQDEVLMIGQFQVSNSGSTDVSIKDLSSNNKSVSTANNFALYTSSSWYSFGNDFFNIDFDQFTNVTIDDIEYFIFSSSNNASSFKTWDNSNYKWVADGNYQLDISQAVTLNNEQQILGGSSFNIMDYYNIDQGAITNNSKITGYDFEIIDLSSDQILTTYHMNDSVGIIGGKFTTKSNVTNLGFIDTTSKNGTIKALNGEISWDNTTAVQSLYVDSSTQYLFIGTNGTVRINDSQTLMGIIIYDLKNGKFTDFQPAQLSNDDSPLNIKALALHDKSNQLLVGGDFVSAGSLDCVGLCIYDVSNTRWTSPTSNDGNPSLNGFATDIKFYQSDDVIISGNFTIGGDAANFITYDFDKGIFSSTTTALNGLGSSQIVEKFIINDDKDKDLQGRMIAYGSDFIVGFDGSKWQSIRSNITIEDYTEFTDIKLVELNDDNDGNKDQKFFDKDRILILAGVFEIENYGLVNVAFFNGTGWMPYVYSATNNDIVGKVNTLLIKDSYRFQSSNDISNKVKHLSKGKVVGVSLACAIGSTTVVGLLYLIPYFFLFRKPKDRENAQRIEEKEMMNAVKPEDLIHEIDMQRNQT